MQGVTTAEFPRGVFRFDNGVVHHSHEPIRQSDPRVPDTDGEETVPTNDTQTSMGPN